MSSSATRCEDSRPQQSYQYIPREDAVSRQIAMTSSQHLKGLFRTETVQVGCPAGSNTYSSSLLENVHVIRHEAKVITMLTIVDTLTKYSTGFGI